MKEIIKKLLKSLPAGFKSTVQETCQILECGFYLPVFLCRNATVLSGESYKTQSKWLNKIWLEEIFHDQS